VFLDAPIAHVCLAGPKVCNDWRLIQALKAGHPVTLLEQAALLAQSPLMETVHVLALDGDAAGLGTGDLLGQLKRCYPALYVLLVDGALDQRRLATGFQQGARDYFPEPYDVRLLAERIEYFCGRPPGGGG
jgi:DNA-binding NtrC family response regulator